MTKEFLDPTRVRIGGKEQPYIPLGMFKLRIPFFHYRFEIPEGVAALFMMATCLGAIPVITEGLGFPYEIALAMVILNGFLYMLHMTFGDPVVPGWITPGIPLVLVYLLQFPTMVEKVWAMVALQLLVAIIFFIMGLSGGARLFVRRLPDSLKAGIVLGAGISALWGCFKLDGGRIFASPITGIVAVVIAVTLIFSVGYKQYAGKYKPLLRIASFGMVPALLIAIPVAGFSGEIGWPVIEWGITVPMFGALITQYSPIGLGFPAVEYWVKALPLAFVLYIIAFGDLVLSTALITDANKDRPDEKIDIQPGRSNIICGVRNGIMGLLAPYPTHCGPLWAAMTVVIAERYRAGRSYVDSIFSGVGTFRLMTFLGLFILPLVTLLKPILPVALLITLVVQGFACAYIAMGMAKTNVEKGVAGMVAVILATQGALWALVSGIVIYFLCQYSWMRSAKVQ